MIPLLLRQLRAEVRSAPLLLALTIAGVALGVASVTSIQLLNRSAVGAFTAGLSAVGESADLAVVGTRSTFAEDAFLRVLADRDVERAWPICQVQVKIARHRGMFLDLVGTDPLLVRGAPFDYGELAGADEGADEISAVIARGLAERLGLARGDSFEVTSGSRRVQLRVALLVDLAARAPLLGERTAFVDVADLQERFGRVGQLTRVDVRLREGAAVEPAAERLAAALGQGFRVLTPDQLGERAEGLLQAFRLNLTALSLVSLFVGVFLVFGAVQAQLLRRREAFGVLRSLGATRRQVIALALAEVALVGAAGTLLGLPIGRAAAAAHLRDVSGTLTNLYLLDEIEALDFPAWIAALGLAVGVGGSLLGALLPALDLCRRDPRELLGSRALEERAGRAARPLLLAGLGVLALAGAAYGVLEGRWQPAGFLLGLAILAALALATPAAVDAGSRLAGRLLRARGGGFGYWYGAAAARLRLSSSAVAAAALGAAVSLLFGITLMIGSFRDTVAVWVDSTIRADVYVTTESWSRGVDAAELDGELAAAIAAEPGVAAVDRLRKFLAWIGDRRVAMVGVDMDLDCGRSRFPLVEGDADAVFRALLAPAGAGAVLVGEPAARSLGLAVGGFVAVETERGPVRLPIAGIYYDYTSEFGTIAMDLATMAARFGPGPVNSLSVYLEPGASAEDLIDRLRERHQGEPLVFTSNAELRAAVFRVFDQTFLVTRLLQVMSLLVAACGVALTLLVQARERAAELALYRALGALRLQVFRVFLGQGLYLGLLGLVLGAAGGLGLAWVLIHAINRAYFGWTIQWHLPLATLALQSLLIAATAVAASALPAWRASGSAAAVLARDEE